MVALLNRFALINNIGLLIGDNILKGFCHKRITFVEKGLV